VPFVQNGAHPSCTFLRKFAIVSEHSLIGLLQNNPSLRSTCNPQQWRMPHWWRPCPTRPCTGVNLSHSLLGILPELCCPLRGCDCEVFVTVLLSGVTPPHCIFAPQRLPSREHYGGSNDQSWLWPMRSCMGTRSGNGFGSGRVEADNLIVSPRVRSPVAGPQLLLCFPSRRGSCGTN
jgi:hypothetical protein